MSAFGVLPLESLSFMPKKSFIVTKQVYIIVVHMFQFGTMTYPKTIFALSLLASLYGQLQVYTVDKSISFAFLGQY